MREIPSALKDSSSAVEVVVAGLPGGLFEHLAILVQVQAQGWVLKAVGIDAGAPEDALGVTTLLADEADQAGRRRGQNTYRVAGQGPRVGELTWMDNVHVESSSIVYRLLLGNCGSNFHSTPRETL